MWKEKLVLDEGMTLKHRGSSTAGFMSETDVDTYVILGADGSEFGAVRVEDHTAVKGFKRTITVIQTDQSGKEVVRVSFNPS